MISGFIRIANARTRRMKTSTKVSDFEECQIVLMLSQLDTEIKLSVANNQARPIKSIPFSYPGNGAFDGLVGSIKRLINKKKFWVESEYKWNCKHYNSRSNCTETCGHRFSFCYC